MAVPVCRHLALRLALLGVLAISIVTGCAAPAAAPAPTAAKSAAAPPAPTVQPAEAAKPAAPAPATQPPQVAKPAGQQVTLRATINVGPDTGYGKSLALFAKRVNELTNGQATVQVFYSATLASEAQALEGMQTGTIDLGVATIYSNAVKAGTILDLPFIFRDFDHWKSTVNGKTGQAIAETAPAVGMRILAYMAGGWRDVYGSRAINGLADFKGFKMRTQQTPAYVELFKAFGAIPTPMAWPEVYLALQQKTIDGAETALPSMVDAKQYEVAKYAALTHHAMSTSPLLASEQRWKALPESVQKALMTAANEAKEAQYVLYNKEDADTVAFLKEKGLTITSPDKAPFQKIATSEVFPKIVTDQGQKALLEEILKP